jgi:hypothetical protein
MLTRTISHEAAQYEAVEKYSLNIVAAAATTGTDVLVPLSSCRAQVFFASDALAESTEYPGATMSGFNLPSEVGPMELKKARVDRSIGESDKEFFVWVAPTAIAFLEVAGFEIVYFP